MTDDLTPNGGTDQLEGRLRSLRADTDGVILADPTSVRRHGDRRRRMTQAGTVLGVAVLAVGVVGVAGTLIDRPAAAPPATQVSEPPTRLATHPFLAVDDLAPIGVYSGFVQASPPPGDVGINLSCLSNPTSWGATETQAQVYLTDLDATFIETVLVFPDVASASAAASRTLDEFAACPTGDPAEATVADRSESLGAGDQSYRLSRSTTPKADADLGYNEIAVARQGSVVVVLDWSSMGSPHENADWAWTPEQVGIALDRAVD